MTDFEKTLDFVQTVLKLKQSSGETTYPGRFEYDVLYQKGGNMITIGPGIDEYGGLYTGFYFDSNGTLENHAVYEGD